MKLFLFIKKTAITLSVVLTIIIGFIISDITIMFARPSGDTINQDKLTTSSSTTTESDTDGEQIVITWLKPNGPGLSDSPVISISNQDFRNTFDSLIEQLIISNN